ncbi:hypothetical protein GGTG_11129 [Gaeumannomyces tritici R3-111a-1]|uniref:Uncharacterized protein n=1 Tax=Gaeumannomyces tritici (strain R3-111a-1) TaxID=644352 RepID=J3PCA6_GAET3|nr:hypothetical protein GGTG_11129 [Gaeumannomyces tritici R3-111a-1]EJT71876.1 hypothetical protein GGTG_11129 [Gaeumannomyces tritici R3-111a-1]
MQYVRSSFKIAVWTVPGARMCQIYDCPACIRTRPRHGPSIVAGEFWKRGSGYLRALQIAHIAHGTQCIIATPPAAAAALAAVGVDGWRRRRRGVWIWKQSQGFWQAKGRERGCLIKAEREEQNRAARKRSQGGGFQGGSKISLMGEGGRDFCSSTEKPRVQGRAMWQELETAKASTAPSEPEPELSAG